MPSSLMTHSLTDSSTTVSHESVPRARVEFLRRALLVAGLLGFSWLAPQARGDESPKATGDGAPATAVADPTKPDLRFRVGWVSTVGSFTYVPEKWGDLHINLVNSRDTPRELLCVTSFDEQPLLQFGRRVWMPARSRIQLTHPVLVPKCESTSGRAIDMHSLIYDAPDSGTELIKDDSGQMLQDGAILVTREVQTTAVIGSRTENDNILPEIDQLLVAGRACQQLSPKLTVMLDGDLPSDETSLNAYRHMVITDDRIADDFAALAAIRHWLQLGGHLWIMLDQVDPLVLERLLGDDFRVHMIDRVGLTTVRIDGPSGSEGGGDSDAPEYEQPVPLARVASEGFEIMHTVNGWPAAMTRRCGEGRLLITTLGPRGWMKPEITPGSSKSPLRLAMTNLATEFFGASDPVLLPNSTIEPLVQEYVGYTVPSWNVIVGTLIGFSLVLAAAGFGLWRTGRMEHLAWVSSVIGVIVSLVLFTIGRSYRHGVNETVASVQVVQAMPGTDDLHTDGVIGAYHPEGSHFGVRTDQGGRLFPDMSGVESATRRMVTTDFGKWHWENLDQPAGLRVAAFTKGETVPDRIEAQVTFDRQGLVGQYSGRIASGTDALVATRDGRIGVTWENEGKFHAAAADLFDRGQYLSANLLGDEQDRRRRVLEQLFNNPKRRDFPSRPQLFFWTNQWSNGFQFAESITPQNSTLVAVPLFFHRPEPGTEFLIPASFVSYQNRTAPDGTPPSTMWNSRRNEWQDRADPGVTWLNFSFPAELHPLTPQRAELSIDLSGPVGLLEIKGLKNGATTVLKRIVDPVGSMVIELDDPEVLAIHNNEGVYLGISAGDPSRPELTRPQANNGNTSGDSSNLMGMELTAKVNYWRINSLKLQLWAKADEPPVKE